MLSKRILVIDNEEYIREVTKICLETTTDWLVSTAGSGQEGLHTAEVEQPDAILLDVMMPDMDGLTTFRHLQANPATQHIPVILLTAKVQTSDRHRYIELGIKDAIAKPFDPLQIANQIAIALSWNLE